MQMTKKITSIVLAVLMVVSMMSVMAVSTASAATYVAKIGSTKYETLEAAFAAAKDGDTITVLADCAGNGIKVTPEGKFTTGLTVDFNNHTYTVDGETVGSTGTETNGFQLLKNNKVTFENGTITSDKAKILVQNYSNLTLDGMTLTLNNPNYAYGYTLSNNNGNTVIKDSKINANPAGGYAFDVCRFSSYPSVSVTVTGDDSVINGNVEISASKSDLKDGLSLNFESGKITGTVVVDASAQAASAADTSGKYSITNHSTPVDPVAKIGDTGYATLADAIDAAQAGDTVTLLADYTTSKTDIQINKNLTIDFGAHTLTASRWPLINNATLTLKGTTGGMESSRGLVDNYGKLIIDSGVYTNTAYKNPAIWNNPDAELVVNGGTINSGNAAIYSEGGSVTTINGGNINSTSSSKTDGSNYSYAINCRAGSTTTLNGGTITAVHGGIVATGNGTNTTTVVINDATITTHNSSAGNDAFYPIYVSGNNTSVTVKDGTFSGPRAAAMIDDDDIGLTENTSFVIEGGTFTSPSGVQAVSRGQNDSYPDISGGTYSSAVPEEFCADGFIPKNNGDGTYTVDGPYEAKIGSAYYETLEEAFAAAQDGNTIEVLADCSGNGIQVIKNTFATGLTVDFGGHTYTMDGATVGSPGTKTQAFQLQYGNKITFKNGTLYSEKALMLVQNYSNLTLDGMTLTLNNTSYNGAYTLSNNNGNTVIKDTKINANPTPGSFAFDVCRFSSYPSVSVTVTGDDSVINGNVEISASKGNPMNGFSLKLLGGTMTGNIVVDPTAKAVLDAKSDKAEVTKDNAFGQTAPEGLVWEGNGDGTSSLVPVEVNPLDALITKATDYNKFGITSQYYAGTILGVQKKNAIVDKVAGSDVTSEDGKQESGNDMRFVAVLDTEVLRGADDYGFVLAKVGSDKNIASVGNEGLDKLKKGDDRFKTISAKNTYNTVCGTSATAKKYGDPTEATTAYKYITCAVNGVDDSSKIVARFYVVKGGKTYYAKYAGHSYKYRGAVAGMSDLG